MRHRVLVIADALEPVQADLRVPCCPEWTVHGLLSHMAGVPADILSGNLDGVTTDPWTKVQVDARADELLDDIVTELADKGLVLDALLGSSGDSFPSNFFLDAWTHEWDLRQALDLPAVPDLAMLDGPFDYLAASTTMRLDEAGLPPIDLVTESGTLRMGSSPAEPLELRTTQFEFARLSLGRRSLRQIAALDWSGDPTAVLEALIVFSPSEIDIIDPVLDAPATESADA